MGKQYTKGTAADFAILNRVIREYHRELKNALARIALVLINPKRDEAGEPKGPAMTAAGDPVIARIRKASPVDRLLAGYDLRIELDAFVWGLASEARKVALLDHELCHVCVDHDSRGNPVPNDDGSPRLGLRGHDWALAGFNEVAERHGCDAVEVFGLRDLHEHHRQLLFGFLAPGADDGKRRRGAKRPPRGKRQAG